MLRIHRRNPMKNNDLISLSNVYTLGSRMQGNLNWYQYLCTKGKKLNVLFAAGKILLLYSCFFFVVNLLVAFALHVMYIVKFST